MSCWTHLCLGGNRLWQNTAKCDTLCQMLDQWTILTSQKVIASQSASARVIIYIIHTKKWLRGKCYSLRNVWDGRTGILRYWSIWFAVAKRSNWQWSRAADTTIDSTTNTSDRQEEFVASESISLETRQVFLVGNGLSWLQCEQTANHFMNDSRELKTTWIRISENPGCPLKIWSFQTRRTHYKHCFAKMKRVLMWDPLKTGKAVKHGKPSWEHEQFGTRHTSWISYWNQHSRHQTHESIFDAGTKMLRSTRNELVNA